MSPRAIRELRAQLRNNYELQVTRFAAQHIRDQVVGALPPLALRHTTQGLVSTLAEPPANHVPHPMEVGHSRIHAT